MVIEIQSQLSGNIMTNSKYNSGVYIITNLINGKLYVGSSCNLNKRFNEHKRKLLQNKHENNILQASVNKYGISNFIFIVLLYCNVKDLLFYEQRAINIYKPDYNICPIAGNNLGYKHSQQAKDKIRAKVLGRKHSEESKKKMRSVQRLRPSLGMLGKNHSEETKEKIRSSNLGKTHSKFTKEKLRLSHLGKKLSEDRKLCHSVVLHSPENKIKRVEAIKNRTKQEKADTKLKLSLVYQNYSDDIKSIRTKTFVESTQKYFITHPINTYTIMLPNKTQVQTNNLSQFAADYNLSYKALQHAMSRAREHKGFFVVKLQREESN
jgi:group I intron endonuclease